ncbi:phosphoenolpyruvate--protein phosphotransferase [Lyngbya aestuarii]|uniref:phosphoenolpyruvate--protein phosphotransferase n=1 Tax=Lyngbya aestuarii TaxID=118322 RepID=UPI00403DD6A2
MVGIVIVSHSAQLAAGVVELAKQMAQQPVPIAIAAGIDDPENPFGTDVLQVQAAIESVYSDAGVVVLMDLGSSVLSAEMAWEFLAEDQKSNVKLCEAPLVEGAIAAVVQAATGANLEKVVAEARSALSSKASQLSVTETEPNIKLPDQEITVVHQEATPQLIRLTLHNPLGIHTRPAAQFVATAARFQAQITVQNLTKNSTVVSAKSINQLITLGVQQGHEIVIAALGDDAESALKTLQQLVTDQFGEIAGNNRQVVEEETSPPLPQAAIEGAKLVGVPASSGVALGRVIPHQLALPEILDRPVDNPPAEWQQLQLAIETAKRQIQAVVSSLPGQNTDEASIFQAHLLYLEDPALLDPAYQRIFEQHQCAAAAWKIVIEEAIAIYQALEEPYLQARAADVRDVGQRVLQLLSGASEIPLDFSQPGILVALEVTPSEVAQLNPNQVLGICTVAGTATAHSSLIAKMLGIPMVVGVGKDLLTLVAGTELALDGETGQIWVEPQETQKRRIIARQVQPRNTKATEAITQDGKKIPVMANIIGVAGAEFALESGAQGVGLLRTEFLYLDRLESPTEEEQLAIYQAIAQVLGTLPLTIRTLDVGGDKPIAYLNLAPETNPFLGWRGIRQSLDSLEVLKNQLRAIVRASYGHNIKVMFPLVSSVREVRAAKRILREVQRELHQAGINFARAIEIGIMIEVPAAVTMADQLATEVDFFSIGTNDLSQYVMAADRTNPKVANLADAWEPAILRMIQQTVTAAHQAGIRVSVCGDLASQPAAIPILLGLGVDELSINPPAITRAVVAISQWRMEETEAIAREVLQLDSADAVREYVAQWH